jgi:hypothetical protein
VRSGTLSITTTVGSIGKSLKGPATMAFVEIPDKVNNNI